MSPSEGHFSLWVYLRGYQRTDISKPGLSVTYSGFHFWPVCWDTSWLLAHMVLEVANRKPGGSRICFPTHLGEKQTTSAQEICWEDSEKKGKETDGSETSPGFVAGSEQRSWQCDPCARLPHWSWPAKQSKTTGTGVIWNPAGLSQEMEAKIQGAFLPTAGPRNNGYI